MTKTTNAELNKLVNSRKNIKASMNLFIRKSRIYNNLLKVDENKLTEKAVIKLDKDLDQVNSNVAKHYKVVLNFLVDKGITPKRAHNFIYSKV